MSLEAGTPQQHRQLWEATFDTPSYVANFKEERGDRNVVHWKSVHSDQKVRRWRSEADPSVGIKLKSVADDRIS